MILLDSIHLYPCKGLAGISVKETNIDDFGPEYDRRWMLVDENNEFLTQRQLPKMVLIRPEIQGEMLRLNAPGQAPHEIPLMPRSGTATEVSIFGEHCEAWEASADSGNWFSQFLGSPCRPVFMPDSSRRDVDPDFAKNSARTSFTDGFPFLLIGIASLEDLNQRLDEPVEMRRFRPNLVISGSEAFEEDRMKRIQIGEISFQVAKPCGRCRVTTVDPDRGEFSGKDPLKTLAGFRRQNGEALFGQNLIHEQQGRIRVGDSLKILEN